MNATQTRGDRVLEVIVVLFLGIATVGTAWCGYQSSQWTGAQTDLAREASDHRVEASRRTDYNMALHRAQLLASEVVSRELANYNDWLQEACRSHIEHTSKMKMASWSARDETLMSAMKREVGALDNSERSFGIFSTDSIPPA